MTPRQVRETRRFRARDDDGQEFVVVEYQNVIDKPGSGRPSQAPRIKFYALLDGTPVGPLGDGTYEVWPHGPIIRPI
jgi:hypothetical protein